jgi:putative ABC transport system permease protein
MKSLGANDRLLIQLFLSEGATLGLIGGLAGFGLGLLLAHEMARQLFNVSLSLTWWTFPLVCLASMMLAVGATLFPVEIVRGIQPARVLRGD